MLKTNKEIEEGVDRLIESYEGRGCISIPGFKSFIHQTRLSDLEGMIIHIMNLRKSYDPCVGGRIDIIYGITQVLDYLQKVKEEIGK